MILFWWLLPIVATIPVVVAVSNNSDNNNNNNNQLQLWGTFSGWSGSKIVVTKSEISVHLLPYCCAGMMLVNTSLIWASNPLTLSAFFAPKSKVKSQHSSAPLSPIRLDNSLYFSFDEDLLLNQANEHIGTKNHSTESNMLLAQPSLITNCNPNNVDHLANHFITGISNGCCIFAALFEPLHGESCIQTYTVLIKALKLRNI